MTERIIDFLDSKLHYISKWHDDILYPYMNWFADKGLMFAVIDKEKVISAGVCRVIFKGEIDPLKDDYAHNMHGDTLWIDHLASDSPIGLSKLIAMVDKRLGKFKYVGYRNSRKNNVRYLDFKRAKQIITNLENNIMGGDEPDAPEQIDPSEVSKENIGAYIERLPEMLRSQQASLPQYGQLAKGSLYQSDLIDPQRTAIKRDLGNQIRYNLEAGGRLTPEQQRMSQQATRGAQMARGGAMYGNAPVAEETFRQYLASNQLQNQRMQQAGQYAEQFAPQREIYSQGMPDAGLTERLFTGAQQQAQQRYGQQMSAYNQQMGNYTSPAAGAAAGAMSGAATGAAIGGPWGAAIGGVAGGAMGAFS